MYVCFVCLSMKERCVFFILFFLFFLKSNSLNFSSKRLQFTHNLFYVESFPELNEYHATVVLWLVHSQPCPYVSGIPRQDLVHLQPVCRASLDVNRQVLKILCRFAFVSIASTFDIHLFSYYHRQQKIYIQSKAKTKTTTTLFSFSF